MFGFVENDPCEKRLGAKKGVYRIRDWFMESWTESL
jgi:hypothetical protein